MTAYRNACGAVIDCSDVKSESSILLSNQRFEQNREGHL